MNLKEGRNAQMKRKITRQREGRDRDEPYMNI